MGAVRVTVISKEGRKMKVFLIAAISLCFTKVLYAADLTADVSPADLPIVKAALEIAKKECPTLAKFDWAKAGPLSGVAVTRRDDPFSKDLPHWSKLGWRKAFVSVLLDRGGDVLQLELGGGEKPAIVSRTAGGYAGAAECGLTQQMGDYTYRQVPALKLIDRLQ